MQNFHLPLTHYRDVRYGDIGRSALFVLAYVALDWVSYLYPLHGLNITPWNPSLALGLAYWFRYGRRSAFPWFLAILLGDVIVRGLPVSFYTSALFAVVLTTAYGLIAEVLRRRVHVTRLPSDQEGLLAWLMIAVIGTLATSGVFVSLLLAFGLIPIGDWSLAWMRFWIGDWVGIVVSMPFFWLLLDRSGPALIKEVFLRIETAGYGLLGIGMLWVAFGLGGTGEFQYFYLLFLPIVWAASRQGIKGAALAAFLMQAGVIVSAHGLNLVAVTVFELQMLGGVLAFVGLFIGTVVDEKQRASQELRHTLRLAAAGEMAAALAHELNQPLTALAAYGAAGKQLLEQRDTSGLLADVIDRMLAESARAADVVSRLRDFFRSGATHLESVTLADLLHEAMAQFSSKATHQGVTLHSDTPPPCRLRVDRLQMAVVLRNLLTNALEATAEQSQGERTIRLSVRTEPDGQVGILVEDSGPGLSEEALLRLFEPFRSTKSSGLGLGLAISRAIAETHGGRLSAEAAGHGRFLLTLPVDDNPEDPIPYATA